MDKKDEKAVFIVEDDAFLVKAYQLKFEKEKINTWVATDGQVALTFLEKDPPSVVMLDLMLPNVNGFEILKAIRKDEKWKDVPVIVLTNLGQPQDEQKCNELGVAGYIVKANTKINDIVDKVKKFL